MLRLLWLVPAIPLVSALALAVLRLSQKAVAWLGTCSIAASSLISLLVSISFVNAPPVSGAYTQVLWRWFDVNGLRPEIALYLDPLSLIMMVVVAFVSFLIHLYSTEFMSGDDGFGRFFAYMNLFVGCMLTLILADNLLLLYLGWEGVGLCSYLLIGFWYRDPANGRAGRKAFIVTRAGDTAMVIGLFLLFHELGTLNIQDLMHRAALQWSIGSTGALAAAFLLLGGAVGKSAQLPLQTWLPDAMAGPTPVSALIHAATMVTAGVYLIARMHVIYSLAPQAQFAVAVIGAATLLMAGFSALTQHDLKRVLAYSTISQIGYMFLALGVGAWPAAIFHFMTHAFFKALLFLGAGIVIESLDGEHDIFRMGGLRKELPVAFWTFLIAGCSLAGLPLITAGAFSKDWIIWGAYSAANGSAGLWVVALGGVFLTALYTFRMIFLVFFGQKKSQVTRMPGPAMVVPCIILAFLSIAGGYVKTLFSNYLGTVLHWDSTVTHGVSFGENTSEAITSLVFLLGASLAYMLFLRRRQWAASMVSRPMGNLLHRFWLSDWGMDWLYDRIFVRPVVWMARIGKGDLVDVFYAGIGRLNEIAWRGMSRTQSGKLRWYAAAIAAGAIVLIGVVIFS
ncbi:MAG TPA: NADH-quinone oxidoreductase subunit L [Edaphobacter sp.]|uniref:NADH-quinone oxidoreductase subunit L n=1 Tax=Edaphobacter sp. TaxID=1934404 RepID=UPI002C4201C6|nr:NADH-quinone oxidoreductase subunit L [Edaphobacter sp.]HUZ94650.1 NADH-quinone oxidoreductase subunit L [Edaphobacter sp.]